MTPDTVEDGGCEVVGKVKEWGREILRRRGGLCKGHFGARVEKVRFGWDEVGGVYPEKERAGGERKEQQPVLDDHGTHYSTDAAADLVGKEDPFFHAPPPGWSGSSSGSHTSSFCHLRRSGADSTWH